jgi:hypothetical protein
MPIAAYPLLFFRYARHRQDGLSHTGGGGVTQTDTPGVTQTVFGVQKAPISGCFLLGLLHPQLACGAVAISDDIEALLQSGLIHTV